MAILIPNMEMPDTCADCLFEYDSMLCRALSEGFFDKEHFDFTVERLPNCPLKAIPDDVYAFGADLGNEIIVPMRYALVNTGDEDERKRKDKLI